MSEDSERLRKAFWEKFGHLLEAQKKIATLEARIRDLQRSPSPEPADDPIEVGAMTKEEIVRDNNRLRAKIREMLESGDPWGVWRPAEKVDLNPKMGGLRALREWYTPKEESNS